MPAREVVDNAKGQQEDSRRNRRQRNQRNINNAVYFLPGAAMIAGGKVGFVVAAHLGREAGNIVTPASQNLSDYRINACAHRSRPTTESQRHGEESGNRELGN